MAFKEQNNHYHLKIETPQGVVDAYWGNETEITLELDAKQHALDILGQPIETHDGMVKVSDRVVYFITPP